MSETKLPGGNIGLGRVLRRVVFAALALSFAVQGTAQSEAPALRFGVTPAIVHDQYGVLDDWRVYLERKLQRKVEFISRDSYRDTIDLIKEKKLDFAWVSTSPYVYLQQKRYASLLATPLYRGRPYYRAYLIVPSSDVQTTSLLQLEGKVFAYADLYSNTGYLVPRYQLRQAGRDENHFFRKTFFTWSHRKVIMAVAEGLADGGSIDSFVWDTLAVIRPELTSRTRIVAKSEEYGFPPIVANASMSRQESAAMRGALLEMSGDADGRVLLKRLNIDGFISGDARLYDRVVKLQRVFGEL
jgi:phosphonate transport system substrate-binding protein